MVINQNLERVEKVELFMTLCSTCSNFNDMIAMIYKKETYDKRNNGTYPPHHRV